MNGAMMADSEDAFALVEALGDRFREKGYEYFIKDKVIVYIHQEVPLDESAPQALDMNTSDFAKSDSAFIATLMFATDHVSINHWTSLYEYQFEYADPEFPENMYKLVMEKTNE